jgi:hypothetical protein
MEYGHSQTSPGIESAVVLAMNEDNRPGDFRVQSMHAPVPSEPTQPAMVAPEDRPSEEYSASTNDVGDLMEEAESTDWFVAWLLGSETPGPRATSK